MYLIKRFSTCWYKSILIFAAFCNAKQTCSDNGLCDSDGKCKCNENYFGPDCKSKYYFFVSKFIIEKVYEHVCQVLPMTVNAYVMSITLDLIVIVSVIS